MHQLASLLADVSCDLGMGFTFARPTTFEEPLLTVGDRVAYYGVDHSLSKALEIRAGIVLNPKILSFQSRSADYPHPLL